MEVKDAGVRGSYPAAPQVPLQTQQPLPKDKVMDSYSLLPP